MVNTGELANAHATTHQLPESMLKHKSRSICGCAGYCSWRALQPFAALLHCQSGPGLHAAAFAAGIKFRCCVCYCCMELLLLLRVNLVELIILATNRGVLLAAL
jgi:hypothetical protein